MDVLKAVFLAKDNGPIPVCSIDNDVTPYLLCYRRRGIDDDFKYFDEFGLWSHPIGPHYHEVDIRQSCCSRPSFRHLSLQDMCLWNVDSLPQECLPVFTRTHCSYYHRYIRLYDPRDTNDDTDDTDTHIVAFFDSSIFYNGWETINDPSCGSWIQVKKSLMLEQ